MNTKILYTALESLQAKTGLEARVINDSGNDYVIEIDVEGDCIVFNAEVRSEVRVHQMDKIKVSLALKPNYLLIGDVIFPKVKELLRANKISYLDTTGNIYLHTPGHFIWVEGAGPRIKRKEKIGRAFTATGLRVIYLFLINPDWINKPYRAIAEETGVALGNLNYIFQNLLDQNFLIKKNKNEFILNREHLLFEKWIAGWEEKLKPTLHIGNFRFLKKDELQDWQDISLKPEKTFWGGEPAGALLTKHLLPEKFIMFTEESRSEIMKAYRLLPDPNGNISIFKKFWKHNSNHQTNVVHPMLVYADLINEGDRRCLETAKIIRDELLRNGLQ
jgi:hypothetical protein